MQRRDFLLLRTEGSTRVVELSCERLYMRYADALATNGRQSVSADPWDGDPWEGEPPAVVGAPTPAELLRAVQRELRDADVLRVLDRSWLVGDELRARVDHLLASFRARGGHVEFSRPAASTDQRQRRASSTEG